MNALDQKTAEKNVVHQENGRSPSPRPARGFLQPQVNIFENKDAWTVEAEMPGVNREGLEILLEGNELTLVGHKTVEQPQAEVLYRECADRDYRRSFVLDPTIDTANISARVENGILRLNLPKAEKVKPRKIVVE